MIYEIQITRIAGKSFYKLLFVGLLLFHIASTLLVLMLTLGGVLPLEPSAVETPISTLLAAIGAYFVLGTVLSPIWVGVMWLSIWPGLWLYSYLRPMKLHFQKPEAD